MAVDTILVTAASGNIGTRLIPLLLSTLPSTRLILPTSSAAKLAKYASNSRISIEEGSIKDPYWLGQLFVTHSVSTVFLNLTGTDELFTTMNALDSFQRSGTVKHLVYVSGAGDWTSPAGIKTLITRHTAGHVLMKTIVEQKLQHGGFPFSWTVLGPTLFFDNDLSFPDFLQSSLYDIPLGSKGISRVSCADIALAGVKAVEDRGKTLGGKKITIGSLHKYTDADTAALWSKALGREVHVRPADEEGWEAFEAATVARAGKVWGRDIALMYRVFSEDGWGMTEEEYAFQVQVLGKEPDRYEDGVIQMANGEVKKADKRYA
ncbi:hypothetical protein LTR56_025514 [Elasticomyces elasticus]|nr:hypothetical protein LTR56_025514 [Elasticomyces elasticus]KAK3655044.1 hypothetical protein LTR22_010512 [Elasticomyces elasticus]KAK4904546.1 hypothetical protein LTR49_026018 [Elasticomyces elasticus]KAK5740572.1 hypothetical protein LTS12_024922 [Elasticomyces elasticus]